MVEELTETLNLMGVLGIEFLLAENLEKFLRDESGVGELISVAHEPPGEADAVFVGGLK